MSLIVVKLNANRMVVGTLRGFDQFMNLVVDNTVEVNGNEKNDIGMVVSPSFLHFSRCFFSSTAIWPDAPIINLVYLILTYIAAGDPGK